MTEEDKKPSKASKAPTVVARFELDHPITYEEEELTGLTLTALRGRMLRGFPSGDLVELGHVFAIGGHMAGYETEQECEAVIGELWASDITKITRAVNEELEGYMLGLRAPQKFSVDKAHTVELQDPVRIGSEERRTLTLEPMRGKHVWNSPRQMGLGDLLDVAERQSGEPRIFFDRLSARDSGRVLAAVNHFLRAFRGTGETL